MATENNAHSEAPSGGRPAFPPFQQETFASQVVWLVLVFALLYVIMAKVALPRVGSIIDARKAKIDGDLAEAERLKGQSDAAVAAYEKSLADARGRAQALAAETHQKQAEAAETTRKSLEGELATRIEAAEKSIAATRTAAMANVATIATETAGAIVERLIGKAPAQSDVAAAVADTLKR